MASVEDLKDEIAANAQGPKKVSGDAGSTEQHPLKEQIAADRYLASKAAGSKHRFGLRIATIVPPGAS